MSPAATVVVAQSKPQAISALRSTWRASAEHKAAQIERFLFTLGGVLTLQVSSEIAAGKDPLTHFADPKTAWYYLLPFIVVAWRQYRPSMTAGRADSAPGVTIVPQQVGVPADPVPLPAPAPDPVPVNSSPITAPGVDTTPTGDGPPVEGDAAP